MRPKSNNILSHDNLLFSYFWSLNRSKWKLSTDKLEVHSKSIKWILSVMVHVPLKLFYVYGWLQHICNSKPCSAATVHLSLGDLPEWPCSSHYGCAGFYKHTTSCNLSCSDRYYPQIYLVGLISGLGGPRGRTQRVVSENCFPTIDQVQPHFIMFMVKSSFFPWLEVGK